MKQTYLFPLFSVCILPLRLQASPDPNTWYLGAGSGYSFYTKAQNTELGDPTHKTGIGATLLVGYQWTNFLGLEFGYNWLNFIKYNPKPSAGTTTTAASPYITVNAVRCAPRLTVPFWNNHFDLFAELGGAFVQSTWTDFPPFNPRQSDVSWFAAAGAELAFTRSAAARIEYQYLPKLCGKEKFNTDPINHYISFALLYRFGQKENYVAPPAEKPVEQTAPKPVLAPPPVKKPIPKKQHLSIRFRFNQTQLSSSAQRQLDALIAKANPNGQIVIDGFTDPYGTVQVNRRIARERAEAVRSYLSRRGINTEQALIRIHTAKQNKRLSPKLSPKQRKQLLDAVAGQRQATLSIG